jgi:ankyrin repeat protein
MALLEKGADVQAKNSHGVTPLLLACENGHYEIAALLRIKGAVE